MDVLDVEMDIVLRSGDEIEVREECLYLVL